MINNERLLETFLDLVRIDSLSLYEKDMAARIYEILSGFGFELFYDDVKEKVGSNTSNLICHVKGDADFPKIMLCAHMDTVNPGNNKVPRVEDGFVYSDGSTILGADDLAGVSVIIEVLRALKESAVSHGDIWAIFTVAEEVGLLGAKNIDFEKWGIFPDFCYVLDNGGKIGSAAVGGPYHYSIKMIFKGKAAHAGVEPEKGVNAIKVAASAIDKMPSGRIADDLTCNIGTISGGTAANIVCDEVKVEAEVRSLVDEKALKLTKEIISCAEKAVSRFEGSALDYTYELEYPGFYVKNTSPVVSHFVNACESLAVEPVFEVSGGGSDTNIFNSKGVPSLNISVGMDLVHTNNEKIKIDDLTKACELVYQILITK